MTDESPDPKPYPAFIILNAMAYLAIAGTIAGFLARLWWPLDVLCNLRFQYGWLLLLFAGPMAWGGYRKHAVVAGAFSLLNLALIAPLYFGASPAPAGEARLRIMALNVLTSNRDYGEVISIVEQGDPDMVIFLEVNLLWIENLAPIQATLPHSYVASREDNFGIAIFSRKPLDDCRFVGLAGSFIEAVVATTNIAGKEVRIIGGHSLPPVWGTNAAIRNHQLQHLAQLAAEHSGPTVLVGDLNTTHWSPYFQDLLREGELRDTRPGYGLQLSHSVLFLLQMTLDHILVSEDVQIQNRWVTPCRGSDHDAVVADLSF